MYTLASYDRISAQTCNNLYKWLPDSISFGELYPQNKLVRHDTDFSQSHQLKR